VLIVQGGLHHLPNLPLDLEQTFAQMQRVLRKDGRVMVVEPWRTPFLDFIHFVSEIPIIRRLSGKMDAFATMVENEIRTYEQWLNQPEIIRKLAGDHFVPIRESTAWGKWSFLGTPR
jgi:ubiquinone/menaquinone biosynthesis C-methylase UbiE